MTYPWQEQEGQGLSRETVRMTEIDAPEVVFNTDKINVDLRSSET